MKWFLLLNLIIVTILFILIRKGKTRHNPSKLNFNKKTPLESESFEAVFNQKRENNDPYEKILNILFQYNGETWDAYEVLGIPAGSAVDVAKKAFEDNSQVNPDSRPFLKAAYEAVVVTKQNRG